MLFCFQNIAIQPEDTIRLKIVGTRVDASGIVRILYLFFNITNLKK